MVIIMTLEICTVGGYDEVGKNMLAIRSDNEVVILDMGLDLEAYIQYNEDDDVTDMSAKTLTKIGAIPDVNSIKEWHDKVIAIVPTHAHLDHIGAIPFLSKKFDAPIIGTPFTLEVLKSICDNERIKLSNPIKTLNVNTSHKASENITIEFVNMTHSTPQTVCVVIHTPNGKVVYATDFKFDNQPVLGKKSNMKRLRELGESGDVVCLVCDSLYAGTEGKTPSETVAREMLKDVMLGTENEGKAVIVSTFSSQIARLKTIIELGKQLNRNVVFLGRSLARYVEAAEAIGIVNFTDSIELCKYRKHIAKRLKKINKEKEKHLIVCTGHQGEPKAVLSRMARGEFEFNFDMEDHVIFSCTVIPVEDNIKNREQLEKVLRKQHVRIFKDEHVSGHPCKEDLRDLINILKPGTIIPCHGDKNFAKEMKALLEEMDFDVKNDLQIMSNGERLEFN